MSVKTIGTVIMLCFSLTFVIYFNSLKPEEPTPVVEVPVVAVIEEPSMPDEELECLAINTYHEARGQSTAGQIAVMFVVLNRAKSPYFPNTICDVVTEGPTYVNWKGNTWPVRDKCQFSWYCDGMSDTIEDKRSYNNIMRLAKRVALGNDIDYTEGSLFYHADYVKPDWHLSYRRVTQIDNHIFYARF